MNTIKRKTKMEHKTLSVKLSKQTSHMLDEILGRKGFITKGETVRFCIALAHEKIFKDYVEVRKAFKAEVQEHTDAKSKAKNNMEAQGERVCNAMVDAEILESETGARSCKFPTYIEVGGEVETAWQTYPLSQMQEYMLGRQFEPDEETIKEIWNQKKK